MKQRYWRLFLLLFFCCFISSEIYLKATPFADEIEETKTPNYTKTITAVQTSEYKSRSNTTVLEFSERNLVSPKKSITKDFLIIGHMGAPMHEPDNTIESFQKALELGANAIETDICITKDGHLVHWHDWSPDEAIANFRQLGKQGLKYRPYCPTIIDKFRKPCSYLTLDEFRQKYGYTLRDSKLKPQKKSPHVIPTFEEFCQWAVKQASLKKIFLDVKLPASQLNLAPVYFGKMIEIIEKYNLKGKIICMIPNEKVLKEALKLIGNSGLTFCYDREIPPVVVIHPSKFTAVKRAIDFGIPYASIGRPVATIMGYNIFKTIITDDLREMAKHNFSSRKNPIKGLIVWTIDNPEEMKELIQMGVHGIITNKPDLLKHVVDQLRKAPQKTY